MAKKRPKISPKSYFPKYFKFQNLQTTSHTYMELGPAQICTACTPFIYLLLLHFLLIFLLLKNDTVAQIAHLQSHFYLPHFSNMEIEKKIQKILPKQKNGLLFNQVLMCKYYSKRFFTLFSYFLLRVFLFSLKNT